jgi:hypothetical protein
MTSTAPEYPANLKRPASSVRFFFAAHAVLLLAVAGGFSRTFYLRPLFSTRPLPPVLYLHGAVLTAWFLLTVMQGWLIQTRRVQLHRRTGYFLAAYAAVVVVMGVIADLRMGSEITAPRDPEGIVFWGNLFSLVLFATFLSLAIVFRKRPETHKRLTLVASISIVGPAVARFADLSPSGAAARPFYGGGGLLALFGALILYDLIVRRRPHPVSIVGLLSTLVAGVLAAYLALSGSGFVLMRGA